MEIKFIRKSQDNVSIYWVENRTQGFEALVKIAEYDGLVYTRNIHVVKGFEKLNCFLFKQNLENRVIEYHKERNHENKS